MSINLTELAVTTAQRIDKLERQVAALNLRLDMDAPTDMMSAPRSPDEALRYIVEGTWKSGVHYFGMDEAGPSVWVKDPNLAMGFATARDADLMIRHLKHMRVGAMMSVMPHVMQVRD